MPRRPPLSPLESFLDNLRDAVIGTVDDLVDSATESAREWVRRNGQAFPGPFPSPGQIPRPKAPKSSKRTQTKAPPPKTAPATPIKRELTLYDVLQVSPYADQETIAAAFRSLSIRHHPDRGTGKRGEDAMKRFTAAYAILKDPEKRKKYNREIGVA